MEQDLQRLAGMLVIALVKLIGKEALEAGPSAPASALPSSSRSRNALVQLAQPLTNKGDKAVSLRGPSFGQGQSLKQGQELGGVSRASLVIADTSLHDFHVLLGSLALLGQLFGPARMHLAGHIANQDLIPQDAQGVDVMVGLRPVAAALLARHVH